MNILLRNHCWLPQLQHLVIYRELFGKLVTVKITLVRFIAKYYCWSNGGIVFQMVMWKNKQTLINVSERPSQ